MNKIRKVGLPDELPEYPKFVEGIRRAPARYFNLNEYQTKLALKNALRYIPKHLHKKIAPEFMDELITRGRIYGYRYRPNGKIWGKPINEYEGNTLEGKAFQVMIENNLDFDVALYPYELVTYGETGQVFQNWMQYRLVKKYLEIMNDEQTLVVASGHPLGLFPSHKEAPRIINTNSMMIGIFDNPDDWHIAAQLGVANYGQMTAGGWMYIGPQGIVHGTYITILNAAKMFLNVLWDSNLAGHLFISSGLGGMSGAQAKAVEIAGGVGIIAEVDKSRIDTRHNQGWVSKVTDKLDEAFDIANKYLNKKEPVSIAYHGNVVDLLGYMVEKNISPELISDQTSCHVPYDGGYIPQGLSLEEAGRMIKENRNLFAEYVNKSLRKHFELIKILHARGGYFWDYGNSFLKAVFDAGVKEVAKNGATTDEGFVFPSYVEDIMGPLYFDYGYGPFRWICLSHKHEDLTKTDMAAAETIDPNRRMQDRDNYNWIKNAEKNRLVVGTEARILYADAPTRIKIALRFNKMVRKNEIGPIMLGRDHHDTGGTDSPFRETSNIKDGSNIMADMAVHCFAGNAARGMSMVVLSNGGGVGIGKAKNGGFGLVLDGSKRVDEIIKKALDWDVMVGVSRRSWARNEHAIEVANQWNEEKDGIITMPQVADDGLIENVVKDKLRKRK
ncbi:MAG: urocanate hydratase [bacterium]|nr:MAG: urocanate hydratase [bacterium]